MRLHFLGAQNTVTGSKTLLEFNNKQILIDCGMFQGVKDSDKLNQELRVNALNLRGVFLTHAHLDHCGMLPYLVKQGYANRIYSTSLTRDVARVILEDSVKVQLYRAKEEPKFTPFYDMDDVLRTMELFEVCDFDKEYEFEEDFVFRFSVAGHILGASILSFTHQGKSVVFSGDLGRERDVIHPPPDFPAQADFLVLESTYGNRVHTDNDPLDLLEKELERVLSTQGVLFVPAFALARSQIIVYLLWKMFEKRPELKLPIYLDSPMGVELTKIYLKNESELNIPRGDFDKALKVVKLIEFGNDVKKLARAKAPYILISSSGMISGGKAMKHFDMLAKHEKNTIMLTGFQGEGTIGKALLEGKEIRLFGHRVNLRARVVFIDSLSGHADSLETLTLLEKMQRLPRIIFLNHGETEAMDSLKEKLEHRFKECEVVLSASKTYFDLEVEK